MSRGLGDVYKRQHSYSKKQLICKQEDSFMSNSSNGNSGKASGGIGFFGVLQLILITLKLCKVITWSWWLVLLPIWIGVGLTAILIVIIVIATILK
jgi:hypothetical protein